MVWLYNGKGIIKMLILDFMLLIMLCYKGHYVTLSTTETICVLLCLLHIFTNKYIVNVGKTLFDEEEE